MKKLWRNKKILIIIFVAVFSIFNIVWGINYYTYYKYTSSYDKAPQNYSRSNGDYTFTIKCPSYLRFIGNYAITNNDNGNEDKELFLIVWPSFLGDQKNEYGVMIKEKGDENIYSFYADENLRYLPSEEIDYTQEEQKQIQYLLNKYEESLVEMCKLANSEWNLHLNCKDINI